MPSREIENRLPQWWNPELGEALGRVIGEAV